MRIQSEGMEITFINNFSRQMPLILRYILLVHIICMPKLGNHQPLMELFKEINLGNKLDFQLFLLLIKNSSVIESYKNSNKKYVDLTY